MLPEIDQPPGRPTVQGCKRDVEVRHRDETETFGFQFETIPRPSHFSRDRDRGQDVWFWVQDKTKTETFVETLACCGVELHLNYFKHFCLA